MHLQKPYTFPSDKKDVFIKEDKKQLYMSVFMFYIMCWSILLLFNPFHLRFDAFMDYSIPEILRVPLEELCLHIMVFNAAYSVSQK